MASSPRRDLHEGRPITQNELAERWRLSPRTLEKWRTLGIGPDYIKVGGRVRYREDEILAYERERSRGGR